MKDYVNAEKLQEYTTGLVEKLKTILATKSEVGTPLVASAAADMTDTDKIYVYVGSESGYTAGNWYYYNGSAWVSGGVYNSTAFETDTTLSVAGAAADAKATGDKIDETETKLYTDIQTLTDGLVEGLKGYNKKVTNLSTGNIGDDPTRLLSDLLEMHGEYIIDYPDGMDGYIITYPKGWSGSGRLGGTGWLSGGMKLLAIDGWRYRLAFRYNDNSVIDPSVMDSVKITSVKVEDCKVLSPSGWSQGRAEEDGTITPSYTTRICSSDIIAVPYPGTYEAVVSSGYAFGIRYGARSDMLSGNEYWFRQGDKIVIPDGKYYFRLSMVYDAGTSSQANTISPSDAVDVVCGLRYKTPVSVLEGNENAIKIADGASYFFSPDTSVVNLPFKYPVIAHTSDVHGDAVRLARFADFCDDYRVDYGAITGDIVAYNARDGQGFFHDIVNGHSTLFGACVGNHDVRGDVTDAEVYAAYMQPVAAKIGNSTGKLYYYTDLAAKSLRIISVSLYEEGIPLSSGNRPSMQHMSTEQIQWLADTLAATPAGYGVMIMMHTVQGATPKVDEYPVFYQVPLKYSTAGNSAIDGKPVYDIVDAFISKGTISKTYTQTGTPSSISVTKDFSAVAAGVEFIGYMVGHWHADAITYVPTTVNRQLMLNVTCTNALYGGAAYPYLAETSDIKRNGRTSTQDAFNLYIIDRDNKKVKVVRIGANRTYTMAEREFAEYPYAD